MTARKAMDLIRYNARPKRQVLGESVLVGHDPDSDRRGIEQVIGKEPTPEFAVMVGEECNSLLDLLADDDLKAIALAKLEGYTNEEISKQRDCSVRTVERQLQLIRKKWEAFNPLPDGE